MRSLILFCTVFFACGSSQKIATEPLPAEVKAVQSAMVSVLMDATCDNQESKTASDKGFFVKRHVVVTVDHIMKYKTTTFPDFAVINNKGECTEARYSDRRPSVDLLFLHTVKPSPVTAVLADRSPEKGTAIYVDGKKSKVIPFPDKQANKIKNPAMFSGLPKLKAGDSGTPAFDEHGKVAGMYTARVLDESTQEHFADAFLSAYVIKVFLRHCAPCE